MLLTVRKTSRKLTLSASGTTNLGEFVPATRSSAAGPSRRVIGARVRVITAANGTGTLSLGTTTGGAATIMTTSDVGLGTAGVKSTATGSELAGNGTARSTGASPEYFTATYTRGTDSNQPVVRITILDVDELAWQAATKV